MEASIDKTTVSTELAKTETVTVTLTSVNGYAGDVMLAATLKDATDAPLSNVNLTGPTSVTLAADGTATAAYMIQVPTDATGSVMTGTLRVAVTSSGGNKDFSSAVTVNNIYTVDYPAGTGGTPANHPNAGMNITIRRGTILRFPNHDTIDHIIHGDNQKGFQHENQSLGVDGLPGRTYDMPTIAIPPGTTGTVGCHTHGTASYGNYTVQ